MLRKCFCGHCPKCRSRKVSQKRYTARCANPGSASRRERRIYDLKPIYNEPVFLGLQSTWTLVEEALIGRGEARHKASRSGCE
jgi:hypothetical protein